MALGLKILYTDGSVMTVPIKVGLDIQILSGRIVQKIECVQISALQGGRRAKDPVLDQQMFKRHVNGESYEQIGKDPKINMTPAGVKKACDRAKTALASNISTGSVASDDVRAAARLLGLKIAHTAGTIDELKKKIKNFL